jgi:hypothetical protein
MQLRYLLVVPEGVIALMSNLLFRGSYMDGCGVDLPTWCGLDLTSEQEDILWNDINEHDLLLIAGGDVDIDEEFDSDHPGQSDTFYSVSCNDITEFKTSLRKEILEIIAAGKS